MIGLDYPFSFSFCTYHPAIYFKDTCKCMYIIVNELIGQNLKCSDYIGNPHSHPSIEFFFFFLNPQATENKAIKI